MNIRNTLMIRRIGLILLLLASVNLALAKTIYVKPSGAGNGTSWTNAYGGLQDALDAANSGDQIWAAAGTYIPTYDYGLGYGSSRYNHFQMKNGVAIYGGFVGTESALSQRDIYTNETILSGDLNGDDGPEFTNNAENCLHIFFHPDGLGLDGSAVLDGFTITAGKANGPSYPYGGGMFNKNNSPTVNNCTFMGNYANNMGGGMYNYDNSHPTVTNCIFYGNLGYYHAGGMANRNSSGPILTNCSFSDNTTVLYHGGGMANFSSMNVIVTNCIFYGNSASGSGNEIYNSSSTTLIAYSNIAGCLSGNSWDTSLGTDGGGNMDENPRLGEYLQLQAGSPCIDAADGDAATSTDLLGNLRYDDPAMSNIGVGYPDYVDMGACEYRGGVTTPTTYTLSVYASGATSIPISSSTGHGGTTNYAKTINESATVTLTAPATSGGASFTGWTGSVTSSNQTVSFAMNANKSVTANYQTVTTTYTLTVYSSGATSVPISSSTGHGGTTNYAKTVNASATVTLTAPILSGKTFTGWTGSATSSSQTISLSMNANKFVTANYQTATTTHSLSVYASGATSVPITSSTGHSGTTTYLKTVTDGTTVTLTAPILAGKTFTGWTGSVSSSSQTISLAMNANKFLTANYETSVSTTYTLYVYSSGTASVAIASSSGQGGTTSYTKTVNGGTTATLTAPATWSGMTFTGWTGSVTSANQTISLSMNATKYVIAHYETTTTPTTYSLSVYASGATGVIISSSTGHSGTTHYAKTVNSGTTVTLTAPATSGGASFTGWTGSINSSSQTISLAMNAAKSITANYETVTTPTTHTLSVYSRGATGVPITSTTGHSGTTNYAKTVNSGTTVTLTAPITSGGMAFDGWTGAVSSSSQTISLSMTASKSVTANYTDSGCVSSTVSVDSIVPDKQRGSKGQSFGYVTVTVRDNCGNAVANADVVGTFTGSYSETLVATTNAHGIAIFTTTTQIKKPGYTFCVDDIDHGTLSYNSVDNVETCDSY